jgi:phosphoribosylformylglycinamidine (FGAM) synthase PurS component
MEIETIGLGAGSYPEPPEEKTKTIEVTINIEYKTEVEIPEKWDRERIYEDIKENISDYINNAVIEDYEIEV